MDISRFYKRASSWNSSSIRRFILKRNQPFMSVHPRSTGSRKEFVCIILLLMDEQKTESNHKHKSETASDMFHEFYDFCLENGIEPEQIVKDYGEMMLITNQEDADRCEDLLNS